MGLIATEAASSKGVNCCVCGTAFWMEGALYDRRQTDGKLFWCPNGHQQHFTVLEATRLRQQLEAKERELADVRRQRDWQESRAKGANIAAGMARAKADRLLTRVEAGVCPHCNRTFKQLAEHMKSKHAECCEAK